MTTTGQRLRSEELEKEDSGEQAHVQPGSTPPDQLIGEVKFSFPPEPQLGRERYDRTLLAAPVTRGVPGLRLQPDPGDGFTIHEVARYCGVYDSVIVKLARKLRFLKRLPHSIQYRPLTRGQVKAILLHRRTRTR